MGVYREIRFRKGQSICHQDLCLTMVRLSCTSRSGNLCGIQFTNGDAVAVCCVVNSRGSVTGVRFLKGGKYYAHRCRRILNKIEICSDSSNYKYWKNIENNIPQACLKCSYYKYCHGNCCLCEWDESGCPSQIKIFKYLVNKNE